GDPISFSYDVLNASLGDANEARLRAVTRVYASGRLVYQGRPADLDFPAAAALAGKSATRQVKSTLQLDANFSAGEYALEVEVTDLLAIEGAPRVATQYATF